MSHPICVSGFNTKTILVKATKGTKRITVQRGTELGLPDNFLIYGFWARPHGQNKVSYDNNPMVPIIVFENSFINLITKSNNGRSQEVLLSNYRMASFVEDGFKYIEPILSGNIDWSASFIELNATAENNLAVAADDSVYELVVFYTLDNKDTKPIQNNTVEFRTGFGYLGGNTLHKQIELIAQANKYLLSATNTFGMPRNAWLIGVSVEQPEEVLRGEPLVDTAIRSSFLSIQQESTLFIENYPIELVDYLGGLPFQLNYFPIVPIPVEKINWTSSNVTILDNTQFTPGQVFQIQLYWVHGETYKRAINSTNS
jgi:hypothetical protein